MTDDAASAEALGERIYRATESLDLVRDSIDREAEVRAREVEALELKYFTAQRAINRARRSSRIAAVALALAVIAIAAGLIVKWQQDEADERDRIAAEVVACNNANLSRQAIQDEFDVFITLLGAAGTPPATPEAAEARRQLIEKFRQDFRNNTPQALRPRDCSVEAVTSPTLVTTTTVAAG
jgi:hypothetical protein